MPLNFNKVNTDIFKNLAFQQQDVYNWAVQTESKETFASQGISGKLGINDLPNSKSREDRRLLAQDRKAAPTSREPNHSTRMSKKLQSKHQK